MAAILFGSTIALGPAAAKQVSPEGDQQEAVASFDIPAAGQFISIRKVEDGAEALHLSARLSETSIDVISNVHWTVSQANGTEVYNGSASALERNLPPGDYVVEASYGLAKIREDIALPRANALNISFVMNAGALRILPSLKDIPDAGVQATSKVYALDGQLRGQLVTSSRVGGEVIVMSAGAYRIESVYKPGNVSAVTDVTVKAGVMSAVNVNHVAGVITLIAAADDEWSIESSDGSIIAAVTKDAAPLVLKPGTYTATRKSALFNKTVTFEIEAGRQSELTLN